MQLSVAIGAYYDTLLSLLQKQVSVLASTRYNKHFLAWINVVKIQACLVRFSALASLSDLRQQPAFNFSITFSLISSMCSTTLWCLFPLAIFLHLTFFTKPILTIFCLFFVSKLANIDCLKTYFALFCSGLCGRIVLLFSPLAIFFGVAGATPRIFSVFVVSVVTKILYIQYFRTFFTLFLHTICMHIPKNLMGCSKGDVMSEFT